jgi:hypothetical protein
MYYKMIMMFTYKKITNLISTQLMQTSQRNNRINIQILQDTDITEQPNNTYGNKSIYAYICEYIYMHMHT